MKKAANVSWRNFLFNKIAIQRKDGYFIVSAGNSQIEFPDADPETLFEEGFEWVIPCFNTETGQPILAGIAKKAGLTCRLSRLSKELVEIKQDKRVDKYEEFFSKEEAEKALPELENSVLPTPFVWEWEDDFVKITFTLSPKKREDIHWEWKNVSVPRGVILSHPVKEQIWVAGVTVYYEPTEARLQFKRKWAKWVKERYIKKIEEAVNG